MDQSHHIYEVDQRDNYGKKIRLSKQHNLPCYSHKQMKLLYPRNDYEVVAASVKGGRDKTQGMLSCGAIRIPLTVNKSKNKLFYKPIGYVAVKGYHHGYVALLKSRLSAYLIVFLIVLSFSVGGVMGYNHFFEANANTDSGLELENQAVDWKGTLPVANNTEKTDGIKIPGYKQMVVEAESTHVSVSLVNPESNPCYFVIKIMLIDTNELIYESKLIEPGKGLYNISLARPLAEGSYKAQIQYEPYDLETKTRLNGAVINVDLIAR